MNPKELVAQFIEEKLEGDISRLATFPLGNLRNDKVYGCPGRNFDSDDYGVDEGHLLPGIW